MLSSQQAGGTSDEESIAIDTFKALPSLDEVQPAYLDDHCGSWEQILVWEFSTPIGVHACTSQSDRNEDNTRNNS